MVNFDYFDNLSFWDPKEQSFWPSDQVGLLLVGLSALKRLNSHGQVQWKVNLGPVGSAMLSKISWK